MARAPTLRKREIAFALAMGAVAAGGAALIIDGLGEESGDRREVRVVVSGRTSQEVAPFTKIATFGPHNVVITQGEGYSVRGQGSPAALARLEAVVEDGELFIRPKAGFRGGFGGPRAEAATYFITVPRLEGISLAGSGDVRIDRVRGGDFEAVIAGAGDLHIADLRVDDLEVSIVGAGSVEASGEADDTTISIGGSGTVRASALRSKDAAIRIGGSGDVALAVSEEAEVAIMGSGDVDIAGTTKCSVSRMGSGDVRCDDREF